MRLGILGPAQGDLPALARAAQLLLDQAHADKVLYVADDDALDQVVAGWAREIVGGDPREGSIFARAARCASASAEVIHRFVASERARLQLRVLCTLPPGRRTIELLDGRVVLFVFDKATLEEEDVLPASVLVVGKSPSSFIRKAGSRTFVAPGPIGSQDGGAALLDDGGGGLRIEVMNPKGTVTARETVGGQLGAAKMKVQGGSGG
ncbi:hypothetical protein [Chondromyces apiculatus]|uniref:Uncharacterized protein n=1 Tax=Chondromyces apiculatus DSM 436 TaxID=1192034 RepID=A0A017SUW7_9BACT|nr:hypothetical protein [Chondromyces apiculatus]EYF00410.1 Hypothetical protein CAP_0856 [Chondromyces apiculatus DSM 436]